MKTVNSSSNRIVLLGLSLNLILVGCVSQQQYRTSEQGQPFDPKPSNAKNAIIEVATNYTLGFVEFDDQGWLFNGNGVTSRVQIDLVKERFSAELKTNGLLIVAFVHGWKHNASGADSNVMMFHKVLKELAAMEQMLSVKHGHPLRRVVGVYVGWRGLSSDIPYLNNLSFWERKNTAEQVGHGAVIELLSEMEQLKIQSNREHKDLIHEHQRMSTKLIILGHSFGGDIVYSAAAPILTERMVENYDSAGNPQLPKSLGDMVVLINPAFEAARFETLQRLALTKKFPPETNCTLAVFTSKSDDATGIAFPLGRRISTLFETHENREQRKANLTAVGHYAPYITHNLAMLPVVAKATGKNGPTNAIPDIRSTVTVDALKEQVQNNSRKTVASTNELTYSFSHCELVATTNCIPNNPIFNVAVDRKLIPDHGTIDNWMFIRFLGEFLSVFSSNSE